MTTHAEPHILMKIFTPARSESIGSKNLLFEAGEKLDTGAKDPCMGTNQKTL
jgi:hypothetical protein